jgi:hypothetical protein
VGRVGRVRLCRVVVRGAGPVCGVSREQQYARLRHVVNNQRFCVLPAGRRPNLASAARVRLWAMAASASQAAFAANDPEGM